MSLYYLGAFPPEYGGVTIKNLNLYNALKKKLEIDKVDFSKIKRKNFKELNKLIKVLANSQNTFVIGVAGKKTRKNFCKLLYYLNRKAMRNSIILLMGGTASNDIALDVFYKKYVSEYKKIYVETIGMRRTLEDAGLNNIGYYPNGRFKPKKLIVSSINNCGRLKCVFFSLIQPQKGVDLILEVAKKLPEVDFYLYGAIDKNYNDVFLLECESIDNAYYCGIFKGKGDDVYDELRKYDVLLFPTKYKIEGVPGILVESKIAGIAAIASKESYNSEILECGQGILLEDNNVNDLCRAVSKLDMNRELLFQYKMNNLRSSKNYFIENYIDAIAKEIM